MGLGFTKIDIPYPQLCWKKSGIFYILREKKHFTFPEPWESILKASNKKPRVVFSYWELGEDHFCQNARIKLVNNIIKHLSYQEQIILWPLTLKEKGIITPYDYIFWKGIRSLSPIYLVLFGKKIFHHLFPKIPLQYDEFTIKNLKILVLPSIQRMLPDNREVKKFVWEKLKNLFNNGGE